MDLKITQFELAQVKEPCTAIIKRHSSTSKWTVSLSFFSVNKQPKNTNHHVITQRGTMKEWSHLDDAISWVKSYTIFISITILYDDETILKSV